MPGPLSRREFVSAASASLAGWAVAPSDVPGWFPRVAFAPAGADLRGDVLVCVFQRGAMDGLNAVVPHAEAEYYKRRPTLAIAPPKPGDDTSTINLDGFFGLHPALRPLKDAWDDKALAIIQACGSPDPTHSHFDAMDYMERGTPGERQIQTGWLARHLQTMATGNTSPFRAVGIGTLLPALLRGPVQATAFRSIADFHLGGRNPNKEIARLQAELARLYTLGSSFDGPARSTLEAIALLDKLNPGNYAPAAGVKYPDDGFGQGLKQIAQLAKAQVGLEAAAIDLGGWDTHVNQGGAEGQMARLLATLAAGLAAFYRDLGERAKRVVVVTMSEFGRRVQENGNGGTDHGHGNVMLVMGGGVNGGKVYGDWPSLAADKLVAPGDLAVTTDFRDVLGEIVQKRLANDKLDQVFPNYRPKFRGILKPLEI